MHIFKYSPRQGTVAAKMKQQIDAKTKEKRSNILIELSNKNEIEFLEKYVGKELDVLFETKTQGNYIEGHTTNYIKVKARGDNLENTIETVQILERQGLELIGKM